LSAVRVVSPSRLRDIEMRYILPLLVGGVVASTPTPPEAFGGSAVDPGSEDKESSSLLQRTTKRTDLAAAEVAAEERVAVAGQVQGSGALWAILGLTEYKVKDEHDGDWWPGIGDIFAVVEIGQDGYKYNSKVFYNILDGDLDMHLYLLANSTRVKISLYDHDYYSGHDLIGSASFVPLGPTSSCDVNKASLQGGCPLEWTMRKGQEKTATLKGYFATGDAMYRQRRAVNKRGMLVQFEEATREHHIFELARIQNDKIEEELFYAEAGSVFPESLHGILWLDQRGRSLADGPFESDPEYRQVCTAAAEENLVSFGEAAWDPVSRCATGIRQYSGGPLSGHWSWMDAGGGVSKPWAHGVGWHMKYDFCFRDESMTYIDVLTRISLNKLLESYAGTRPDFLPIDSEITLPTWINNVAMVKKPWGWDRMTTLGPSSLRTFIRNNFDSSIIQSIFNMGVGLGLNLDPEMISNGIACHYPVLQVVDGQERGQRTMPRTSSISTIRQLAHTRVSSARGTGARAPTSSAASALPPIGRRPDPELK